MADDENAFEVAAPLSAWKAVAAKASSTRVLAKSSRDRDDAGGRGDEMRSGAAMHAANGIAEAFAPGTNTCAPISIPASRPASTTRPTLS